VQGGGSAVGLTATVADSHYCYRDVRHFRSEDQVPVRGPKGQIHGSRSLGKEGALREARKYAEELNARYGGSRVN
jgi:hypothetical protein